MKIYPIFILSFIIGLSCPGVLFALEAGANIIVRDAWVRAMPPSAKNTAAYMTIENRSNVDIVLQFASTNVAKTVEIHQMEQVGDTMVMRMLYELRIPARERLELKPNSFHLMIISLVKPLKEGETIPIVLFLKMGTA